MAGCNFREFIIILVLSVLAKTTSSIQDKKETHLEWSSEMFPKGYRVYQQPMSLTGHIPVTQQMYTFVMHIYIYIYIYGGKMSNRSSRKQ